MNCQPVSINTSFQANKYRYLNRLSKKNPEMKVWLDSFPDETKKSLNDEIKKMNKKAFWEGFKSVFLLGGGITKPDFSNYRKIIMDGYRKQGKNEIADMLTRFYSNSEQIKNNTKDTIGITDVLQKVGDYLRNAMKSIDEEINKKA